MFTLYLYTNVPQTFSVSLVLPGPYIYFDNLFPIKCLLIHLCSISRQSFEVTFNRRLTLRTIWTISGNIQARQLGVAHSYDFKY